MEYNMNAEKDGSAVLFLANFRMPCKKKISVHMEIALDSVCKIGYNRDTFFMQESPSGMASASQADSGGFDSRFLLHHPRGSKPRGFFLPFPWKREANTI